MKDHEPTLIGVFGTGGHGREIGWLVAATAEFAQGYYIIDGDPSLIDGTVINGKPCLSWATFVTNRACDSLVVAIGDVSGRKTVVERAIASQFEMPAIIHPTVTISPYVAIGKGVVVCEGTILTVNISLGDYAHINRCCSISHDVSIGRYATLSPGVIVSGHVKIGDEVVIGSGATIINGAPGNPLVIATGATIGAGACVTRSISRAGSYVGVPARRLTPK